MHQCIIQGELVPSIANLGIRCSNRIASRECQNLDDTDHTQAQKDDRLLIELCCL
jgi:hypothetical protein